MFIKEGEKTYRFIDTDSDVVKRTLENKLYEVEFVKTMFGSYYNFHENTAYDKGRVAESGVFKDIKEYVTNYFSDAGKEVREEMSLPTRLGLLFTGEPGTGKTFLAGQLAKMLREDEEAIAITTTNPFELDLGKVIDMARKNRPDALVVMIWDEFEKKYKENKNRLNDLLAFLDGVDSRDNVVVVATCNDLSAFPSTLLDRPGRFEKVVEFKIEDDDVLETLTTTMIPEKYQDTVEASVIFEAAKKIDRVSVDKVKSLVRDSIVNKLQGKEDYIPEDINYKTVEISEEDKKDQRKLKRKLRVENIIDYLDGEYQPWHNVDLEEILDQCSN